MASLSSKPHTRMYEADRTEPGWRVTAGCISNTQTSIAILRGSYELRLVNSAYMSSTSNFTVKITIYSNQFLAYCREILVLLDDDSHEGKLLADLVSRNTAKLKDIDPVDQLGG